MRRLVAEMLGTFGLVFAGGGAALAAGEQIGAAGVALAWGLGLAVMTLAVAPVSGAHLNPAVTVAMALTGRLRARLAPGYVGAQLAGGTLGAALVLAVMRSRPGGAPLAADALAVGYAARSPGYFTLQAAWMAETALTALFVFVVLGVTARAAASNATPSTGSNAAAPGPATALLAGAAGAAYTLIHLVGMPLTGLSANPARALGPALFAGGDALAQVWLFLLAPLAGAVLAALGHRVVFGGHRDAASVVSRRGEATGIPRG